MRFWSSTEKMHPLTKSNHAKFLSSLQTRSPEDYPESIEILSQFTNRKPMIGICLGFQMMLFAEGANVVRQKQVLHGVETEIEVNTRSRNL